MNNESKKLSNRLGNAKLIRIIDKDKGTLCYWYGNDTLGCVIR